jgi:hypothetical protein
MLCATRRRFLIEAGREVKPDGHLRRLELMREVNLA